MAGELTPPITELPSRLGELPADVRARVERIFSIDVVEGRTDPPPEMDAWLTRQFGSVDAVRQQRVVRVTNRWTLEGSLISPLRGSRPIEASAAEALATEVERTRGGPFCDPEHDTPADTWGRVSSPHAITGANAAMYDGHHGLVILDNHDPLAFDERRVHEILELGREWAKRSMAEDPAARNYLLIWNCGWRAGGSVIHGHAQVVLGRGAHYARVERLARDAEAFRAEHGTPYFAELVAAHRAMGLVIAERDGVATLASVTPVKERELLIVGSAGMDEREPPFADAVARAVVAYRDQLGVRSFNLALHRPPLSGDLEARWTGFPPIVHLVDRGDPSSRASDIGGMELFAASVVGADPFEVAARMREALG